MNKKTPEEIIRRLRFMADNSRSKQDTLIASAELHEREQSRIAELEAQLAASQRRAQDARNELCQKCGRYHEAHKGTCDGCRWKEMPQ